MSYIHVDQNTKKPGVRWNTCPIRRGPSAMQMAHRDAIRELNAEADAAGFTGVEGHFRFHNSKQIMEQSQAER